ncbi:endonuclease/exonuclease/phosphatase family protein [Dietzia sp. ANT_WB102]|nr:endonuclease/exonuclease/phosphatase family protein [Dietzia sp. ANT_WB102]
MLSSLVAGAGVALHHSRSEFPAVVVLATFAAAAWALSIVALIASVRARSVLLGIIAVALVGVGVVQYGPLVAPPRRIDDGEGIPMRVMVQNLEYGRAAPHDVVRAVRTSGVDLLMTVETTSEAADALRTAGLTGLLPHEAAATAPTTHGVAVWSRFPLSPPERVSGFSRGLVRTEMAGPGGPVTVVAVHPVAPLFDTPAAVEEAERLRWYLGSLPGPAPVVVGGDFNATWDHVRFRDLRSLGYTDSVAGGSDGWVPTWPAGRRIPPLIGIDHVLARGAVTVGETDTVEVGRTDHLGVLATVLLPAPRLR